MRYWFSIAGLFLMLSEALAGGPDMMGIGTRTCGEFAKDYKNNLEYEKAYFSWAEGYLSGLNFGLLAVHKPVRNLGGKPLDEQMAFVRRYCDQHPLTPYASGIGLLWLSLPHVELQKELR